MDLHFGRQRTRALFAVLGIAPWLACLSACTPATAPTPSAGADGGDSSVFPIASGGEIEFPEGSLAANAKLEVATADPPALPPGVDAVGETLTISLDQSASRPMTLRLPTPQGVDPNQVSIFQIESNGETTLLSTEVSDGFLVAATDHFTASPSGFVDPTSMQTISLEAIAAAIGFRNATTSIPDLSPPRQGRIVGPTFLQLGQSGLYALSGFDDVSGEALEIEWNLFGTASLALPTDASDASDDVVLFASRSSRVDATSPGRIDLTISYLDPRSGTRGFAAKVISVQDDPGAGLVLTYLAGATERVREVEEDGFLIGVLDRTSGPVSFEWDYGDGAALSVGTEGPQDSLTIRTPRHAYGTTGTYTAILRATHEDGATGELEIPVTVRPLDLEIVVDGPSLVSTATSPFDTDQYTIRINNGVPDFQIDWELLPVSQREAVVTSAVEHSATLLFSEPGTYVFTAKVRDSIEDGQADPLTRTAFFARPITVTGGNPLSLIFEASTTSATPGRILDFTYAVSGGLLIANGQQQDYRLEIDWGDGETAGLDLPADATRAGVQDILVHTFSEPGTFAVDATVIDAAGTSISQVVSVSVEEGMAMPDDQDPVVEDPDGTDDPLDCPSIDTDTSGPFIILGIDLEGPFQVDPSETRNAAIRLSGVFRYPVEIVIRTDPETCPDGSADCASFERRFTIETEPEESTIAFDNLFECFDTGGEFFSNSIIFLADATDACGVTTRPRPNLFGRAQFFCCRPRGGPYCPE